MRRSSLIADWMRARSSWMSKGLETKSIAPSSNESTLSADSCEPEMITIGMSFVTGLSLRRRIVSNPSIPGIDRSSMISDGWLDSASWQPSSPEYAARNSMPSFLSLCVSSLWIAGESSTSSSRGCSFIGSTRNSDCAFV